MGSVLSSAHAALCSFVGALLDKVEKRRMVAAYPQLSAEEREDLLRWFKEQDARDAAARLRGRRDLRLGPRCDYRHPCNRVDAEQGGK